MQREGHVIFEQDCKPLLMLIITGQGSAAGCAGGPRAKPDAFAGPERSMNQARNDRRDLFNSHGDASARCRAFLPIVPHKPFVATGRFLRSGLKNPKAITSFYNHLKILINKFTYMVNQAKLFYQFCIRNLSSACTQPLRQFFCQSGL